MNRPPKNNRSTIPWVVDTNHIVNWVQKKMPVKHKNKTMYLMPTKYVNTEVILHENMRDGSINVHSANINEITLLIE